MSSISPFSEPLPSPPLQSVPVAAPAPVKPKSKPRKRVNTAEKRHQHNAIERARRESLNNKFLTLARLLPSLANHRRPSKSAIVNGSIGHVNKAREQRLLAATLLKELCKERDELFAEVNEWRKAGGVGRREGSSNAWNDEMEQVCSVETEVFGNFASMGGDDDGEDEAEAQVTEPVFAMPSTNGNGLFTPRDSTDIDPMTMFAQPQRPSAVSFQSMNWSHDFANQLNAPINHQNPTPSMSNSTPLPFGAFMSDSTDSPGTSQLGNSIMLTPPTTADPISMYTHTPSPPAPRPSSASIDVKPVLPQRQNSAQPWTPQQLLFLQQIQQHQAQVRQHQQNLANHYTSFPANVAAGSNNPAEGFTQSLIATMFPQQAHVAPTQPANMNMNMNMNLGQGGNGGMEQVQQWRKAALTSFLQQHGHANAQLPMRDMPSVSPYQQPMLTPLLGMNGNGWSPENEGF